MRWSARAQKNYNSPRTCRHVYLYCTQGWMNLLNGVPLHLAFMSGLCVDVLHLQQPPAFLLLLLASSCATFHTHTLLTLTAGWMAGWLDESWPDGEGVAWEEVEKHRMNGFNHNNDIGYYSPPYKGSAVNGRKQDKSLLYSLICDRHEMERWSSSSSRRKSTILACTVFAQIIFDSI